MVIVKKEKKPQKLYEAPSEDLEEKKDSQVISNKVPTLEVGNASQGIVSCQNSFLCDSDLLSNKLESVHLSEGATLKTASSAPNQEQ